MLPIMRKPKLSIGVPIVSVEPLKSSTEEISDLRTVIDFKMSHVAHQQRLKVGKKSKKARKKRK